MKAIFENRYSPDWNVKRSLDTCRRKFSNNQPSGSINHEKNYISVGAGSRGAGIDLNIAGRNCADRGNNHHHYDDKLGGLISEFSPTVIVVKSETATEPVKYTYTKSTTYVDENGQPVSMDIVKSGVPVTVYYTKDGDSMVATKVVVKKVVTQGATDGGTTVDKKTTTTTTTTDK